MRYSKLMGLLLLALPLMGFVVRPLTPEERALVQHATNNDPAWLTLADTQVSENKDKGLLFARFGPAVPKLKDQDFEISMHSTHINLSEIQNLHEEYIQNLISLGAKDQKLCYASVCPPHGSELALIFFSVTGCFTNSIVM